MLNGGGEAAQAAERFLGNLLTKHFWQAARKASASFLRKPSARLQPEKPPVGFQCIPASPPRAAASALYLIALGAG
jgi:hypothetical protein